VRSLRRVLSASALAFALTSSGLGRATVVERIVAMVGDKAILLHDVRTRARPYLIQVYGSLPAGAQRNAAISQLYRSVLDRLVDEELEVRAAQQSKLTVTPKEIDDAIGRVATQNKMSPEGLIAEATKTGLTEAAYRDELRRQLLEAKLINVRLQGRIRVVEEDLREAYQKLVMEERQRLALTPAWIVLRAGVTPEEQRRQRALAEQIAAQARSADFASLARQYSEDPAGRRSGGQAPRLHVSDLPPQLARMTLALGSGESSPAIRLGDRIVIVKVIEREASTLPDFDQARQELTERVYMDKMARAKKTWLDGLRRQHHVEIRL